MKLISPTIFDPFPNIVAAMSMRNREAPNDLSMSLKQDPKTNRENRRQFAQEVGFDPDHLATPEQDHTDIIHLLRGEYHRHTGDAIITNEPGWLLGVSVADCVPLLVHDPTTGCYGVIHSGWKGSAQNIAGQAIAKLNRELGVRPADVYAWIGPSAGADSYEVGYDVHSQFNPRYSRSVSEDKWLLDNKSIVHDQLLDSGLSPDRIEVSNLDTINNPELHSARRDGDDSGRMLAAIGLSHL